MRIGHTSAYKGKRVLVILRDGRRFVDRFVECTGGKLVVFEDAGRIPVGKLRVMSIYRADRKA